MTPSTRTPAGGTAPRAVGGTGDSDALLEALGEVFVHIRAHVERALDPFDLPAPCAKALRLIDGTMSMKELGARIHCDGSFVTAIADTLEERGLVRREVDPGDRRIKNLVLTARGRQLRTRVVDALTRDVPGLRSLDGEERQALLALLRKMVSAEDGMSPGCTA